MAVADGVIQGASVVRRLMESGPDAGRRGGDEVRSSALDNSVGFDQRVDSPCPNRQVLEAGDKAPAIELLTSMARHLH